MNVNHQDLISTMRDFTRSLRVAPASDIEREMEARDGRRSVSSPSHVIRRRQTEAEAALTSHKSEAERSGGDSSSRETPTLAPLLRLLTVAVILLLTATQAADAIKLQPEGKEKFYWSGETFVITCQNNNNIKNVKIRWIGPSNDFIAEDRALRVHAESTGPHGSRLVVNNATVGQDDGPYKCTIASTDDRNPREQIDFLLKIHQTPDFKDTAERLELPVGQPATLSCHVEFDPQVSSASVQWLRDRKPVETGNDSTLQVLDYDPARQTSQLLMSQVARDHEGTYTCRAVSVTAHLSRVSDHNIQVEPIFAPQFDASSQIVWVESSHSISSRQQMQQQLQQHVAHRNIFPNNPRNRLKQHNYPQQQQQQQQSVNSSDDTNLIRVELRCSCQANPRASILWTSSSSMFMLSKGEPAHIIEDVRTEHNGRNSTSILVVGYRMEPNWPNKADEYICSGTNKLGKAIKTFRIEQGDPPPAFEVAARKHYSANNSTLTFTLLGAVAADPGKSSAELVPPVDAFRIRAESAGAATTSNHHQHHHHQQPQLQPQPQQQPLWIVHQHPATNSVESRVSYPKRQLEPSVQFSAVGGNEPQNYTVSLGKLPPGPQRLFLEAHNAVGWSPNATYLGDYYIVSGASSRWPIATISLGQLLIILLVTLNQLFPNTRQSMSQLNL